MTQFEFLSVFVSIVIAFGVSDLLSSWGAQIRLRNEVRPYLVHFAWSVLLLLLMIQVWWSIWRIRPITEWTYLGYLVLVLPYLLLALIAYILTPPLAEGERDIKRYYYQHNSWLFSLASAFIVVAIVNTNKNLGVPLLEPVNAIRGVGLLLTLSLAISKNERFHAIASGAAFLLLFVWVGMTMFRL